MRRAQTRLIVMLMLAGLMLTCPAGFQAFGSDSELARSTIPGLQGGAVVNGIMGTLVRATLNELPKLVTALVLLGLAWFVGQRLTVAWNLRQKQKEHDLATARDFHALYGEFFAIWKLWNYYIRDVGAESFEGASRWNLLDRACEAEGKLESTLVRLACERSLDDKDIEVLGCFRQLYQQLREAIRDNKPLPWDYSEHPYYVAFKTLAPQVASLIVGRDTPLPAWEAMSRALINITSGEWKLPDAEAQPLLAHQRA